MKTSQLCPKCQSQEIYRIPGNLWSKADPRVQTGWLRSEAVHVTRYLCGQCGYIEEWISDQNSLQALAATLAGQWQAEPDDLVRPSFDNADPSKCPACGGDITPEDGVCPSCGINFGLARQE
ncbi:MAG: hypothetical protein ACRYFS_21430 [Janthinobacterium lividum]